VFPKGVGVDAIKYVRTTELSWSEPGGQWSGQFPGWTWKDLNRTEKSEASLWRLDPGHGDQEHAHSDGDEHIFVLSGEFESGGKHYKAGDYIFRPAGVPHHSHTETGVEMLLIFVRR